MSLATNADSISTFTAEHFSYSVQAIDNIHTHTVHCREPLIYYASRHCSITYSTYDLLNSHKQQKVHGTMFNSEM